MTSLRTKLTVLLAAPLVVLVLAASMGVRSASDQRTRANQATDQLDLALSAQDAALALVQERRLSATAPDSGGLEAQRQQTDHALHILEARLDEPGSHVDHGAVDVGAATDALEGLAAVRDGVDSGDPPADVLAGYGQLVDPVLALDAAFRGADDPAVYQRFQAQRALVRLIDGTTREESLVHEALAGGTVTEAVQVELTTVLSEQEMWTDRFRESATNRQRDAFGETRSVPSVTTAERLRDRVLLTAPSVPAETSTTAWITAMEKKVDLLVDLLGAGADDLEDTVGRERSALGGDRLMAYGLLAAAVGAFALMMLALRRLAVRPIQDLATDTQEAAEDVVASVRAGTLGDSPEVGRPLELPADDELSDIADAFNSVQGAVVTLSAEQAATRDDIHQVFLNFGRRAQNLVTRQLGQIDDLEARTDDPDVLSDLFMLDHLSTRLRRNAESMVVLAGAESPRPWARPVSVVNVVRAAAAEATDYSRVDVANIAPGAIAGATANDVSHLLAELIDNALTYSPPGSRVYLAGEGQAEGRYLIAIADSGLGMSPGQLAEANARLRGQQPDGADGPDDVPLAKYFGLYVVSQLARRHGIAVRLVPSRHNGIQAEVMLPRSIMVLPGGFHAPELPAQPEPPAEPGPPDRPTGPTLVTPPGLVTEPADVGGGAATPSPEPSPAAGTRLAWPPSQNAHPPIVTPPPDPAPPPTGGPAPVSPAAGNPQATATREVRRRTFRSRGERSSAEHPIPMPAAERHPSHEPAAEGHDGER